MNRYHWQKGKTLMLVIILTMGIVLPATKVLAEGGSIDSVADVKAAFDEAMGKSLQERIPLLEALEEDIDQLLFDGIADQKDKCRTLEFKYRVQSALAEYPEAHETFGRYAQELKAWNQEDRARTALVEFVRSKRLAKDLVECVAIGDATLEHWSNDETVAPAVLLEKALCLSRMNGRGNDAIPVLNGIIENFLDSPIRPKAMRQLAHLQANGWGDGPNAALAALSLLEQQYRGTWWEQYAHMKPAMIFEKREGNPQKALERFQATLSKFPDHKFATFCRREIERLQGVIEEQLIQDALEGFAKAKTDTCAQPSVVIAQATPSGLEQASLVASGY